MSPLATLTIPFATNVCSVAVAINEERQISEDSLRGCLISRNELRLKPNTVNPE